VDINEPADMNDFIRGRRRGHVPPPQPDPERDARLVAVLEELGEPVPEYLRPAPAGDWGGGPRGRAIPARPSTNMDDFIRGRREYYP
jgi:hypothetical protein